MDMWLERARAAVEQSIGYTFREVELFAEAVTHSSFSNEQPLRYRSPFNERLEFLGDAVLELVISHQLFLRYSQMPEGRLTRVRADLVNEKSLAGLARSLNLGASLRLGRGEERSGGRDKDRLLANLVEALIGAVFLDGGLEAARKMILDLFGTTLENMAESVEQTDFKTRLQEWAQARGWPVPLYTLLGVEGPQHDQLFTCEVFCNGAVRGTGTGHTKKGAEQEAAHKALESLEKDEEQGGGE